MSPGACPGWAPAFVPLLVVTLIGGGARVGSLAKWGAVGAGGLAASAVGQERRAPASRAASAPASSCLSGLRDKLLCTSVAWRLRSPGYSLKKPAAGGEVSVGRMLAGAAPPSGRPQPPGRQAPQAPWERSVRAGAGSPSGPTRSAPAAARRTAPSPRRPLDRPPAASSSRPNRRLRLPRQAVRLGREGRQLVEGGGVAQPGQGPWRPCRFTSSGKALSAEAASRAVPSGWEQAPLPGSRAITSSTS